ncbi:hypothetical protein Pla22_41740 [Rubripirellula amarantea]|uniref:Uncharacterized protein n=1 Tax=Rubripirellula amarantea TaxID=2527999 RepID=A0A5C5WKS3_9BACT|nr:hypothetical protein Pla22_41740 [Rubripirellula amarantea]
MLAINAHCTHTIHYFITTTPPTQSACSTTLLATRTTATATLSLMTSSFYLQCSSPICSGSWLTTLGHATPFRVLKPGCRKGDPLTSNSPLHKPGEKLPSNSTSPHTCRIHRLTVVPSPFALAFSQRRRRNDIAFGYRNHLFSGQELIERCRACRREVVGNFLQQHFRRFSDYALSRRLPNAYKRTTVGIRHR